MTYHSDLIDDSLSGVKVGGEEIALNLLTTIVF
jgi:hypothetical protein